ncbi:nucleotidyl transferase AbiEii/AbiGii toxin family protein [Reichenbachiella agariperforans]|uniref:nucleotidyl transferase AbiEii/AbiGii toxin family protein n=1 Tax=Reichenbachiella agariperforans TaxID=156994 RepID=UPI001C097049|nr:nucleotidyl transferase AbiEii/AbiGii toxin family protein [Reichenbachiella agariperforans]MBU2914153.1 nucleotidyl transferase AbiEii/AbiGii toxin family protein [Reichenbachiella agariperforans]
MILHDEPKLFRQSIQATAQRLKIKDIYIEKDYWVCYVLKAIFSNEIGEETVFKGGTALSKCYNLVERFSEDIDLVVMRSENEKDNQLKKKIKTISKTVEALLPEVSADITQKMGMNRKTAHRYPKVFKGDFGQVRDVVIVEATWLGYFEPYTTREVKTYIHDMMMEVGEVDMISKFGLQPFEVKVLNPTRTICEKIMSLTRFCYTDDPMGDLAKKIRHLYDLTKMLNDSSLAEFFNSSGFEKMLVKVGQDDVASYKNANQWLVQHPKDAIIYSNTDEVWKKLNKVYRQEFRELVFGQLPKDDQILDCINRISIRLAAIDWTPVSTMINKK